MADYVTRASNVIANVKSKDLTAPSNAFLKTLAKAFVYTYRGKWEGFIASAANTVSSNTPPVSTIVNPSNTDDPTDIGEYNSDTEVFTAVVNGDRNKIYAIHFLREMRNFGKDVLANYRRLTDTLVAGDAGKDINTVIAETKTDAATESITELGDPDNDPEA